MNNQIIHALHSTKIGSSLSKIYYLHWFRVQFLKQKATRHPWAEVQGSLTTSKQTHFVDVCGGEGG